MNKNFEKEWSFSHHVSRDRLGVRLRVRLGVGTTYNPPQSLMYRPFEAGRGIGAAFFADA